VRTRLHIALASALLIPTVASTQRPSRPLAIDPVISKLQATLPNLADPKTRRMAILAEIWGQTGLYHPAVSGQRLNWDSVLVRALGALGGVRSDSEFVALVNSFVFAPLHDPLQYARTMRDDDASWSFPPVYETRALGGGTVYLSVAEPRVALDTKFPARLRSILDSITAAHDVARLVIDLRSAKRASYPWLATEAPWLGMWARDTLRTGQRVSVFRAVRDSRLALSAISWLMSPRSELLPRGTVVSVPTVFLVNRAGYSAVEHELDALRSHRSDIAVVFEESGPIPPHEYEDSRAWYPDSILVTQNSPMLLSADGALGSVVDVTSTRKLALSDIDSVARRALLARVNQSRRAAFAFDERGVRDDDVSTLPLSREQRLAGLLKIWFWVSHFDAYLDDASVDWRQLLAKWVPRVESAKDNRSYYAEIQQVAALLHDGHVMLQHPEWDGGRFFAIPPLGLWRIGERVLVGGLDSLGLQAGVELGDELLAVDDLPVREVERAWIPFIATSGSQAWQVWLGSYLNGTPNAPMSTPMVALRFRTTKGIRDVVLPRRRSGNVAQWRATLVRSSNLHPELFAILPGNIGYLNLKSIPTLQAFDSALAALAGTRGMVIDQRRAPTAAILPFVANLESRFGIPPTPNFVSVRAVEYMHGGAPTRAYGSVTQEWSLPQR